MKIERKQLFEQLQPPAGGIERLRRKIANPAPNRSEYRWQPALAATMLLVALFLLPYWLTKQQENPPVAENLFEATEFDRLLGRPPAVVDVLVLQGDQIVSTVEVEGTRTNVRIYRLNPGS